MTNEQEKLTHTSRMLLAVAKEYALRAKNEGRDGFIHDSRRVEETTADYLRWLEEQRQK